MIDDDAMLAVHLVPGPGARHELHRGFYGHPFDASGLAPLRLRVTIRPCGCEGSYDWVVVGADNERVCAPHGWSRCRPEFVAGPGIELELVIVDDVRDPMRGSNDLVRERLMRSMGLDD